MWEDGAVLIDILQKYNIKNVYAFDINKELINSYNVIKNNVIELINSLNKISNEYLALDSDKRKEYYYNIRTEYNNLELDEKIKVKKASQFIFLNRTCFNGLYRVNKSGGFNVPMGNYKNPTICDEKNLIALSKLIQNVVFTHGSYKESEKYVCDKSFTYFDPPYRPLNIISGFTSYTKEDFNDDDQKELADYYNTLHSKNSFVMLSNSNPKNINEEDNFFDELYNDFNINEVMAKRMINANSNGRGEISEILITNYNI